MSIESARIFAASSSFWMRDVVPVIHQRANAARPHRFARRRCTRTLRTSNDHDSPAPARERSKSDAHTSRPIGTRFSADDSLVDPSCATKHSRGPSGQTADLRSEEFDRIVGQCVQTVQQVAVPPLPRRPDSQRLAVFVHRLGEPALRLEGDGQIVVKSRLPRCD